MFLFQHALVKLLDQISISLCRVHTKQTQTYSSLPLEWTDSMFNGLLMGDLAIINNELSDILVITKPQKVPTSTNIPSLINFAHTNVSLFSILLHTLIEPKQRYLLYTRVHVLKSMYEHVESSQTYSMWTIIIKKRITCIEMCIDFPIVYTACEIN